MLTTEDVQHMPLTTPQWRYFTLLEARHLLEMRGHAKHILQDDNGSLCLRGAINLAAWGSASPGDWGKDGPVMQVLSELEAAMGFNHYDPGVAVFWNNRDETTLEDVLARIDVGLAHYAPSIEVTVPELVPA